MKRSAFAGPYVVWMALFTVAPLLFVVYFAFRGDAGFTLANLQKFMAPTYLNVLCGACTWRSTAPPSA
jgi:spermidine/putrescine transport system permease protein